MAPKKTLIIGAHGQLGRALQADFPGADLVDIVGARLDVTDAAAVAAWPWHEYAVVLNAAAYTAVDAAETPEGRVTAWAANAAAPARWPALAARAPASRSCTTPASTSSTAPPLEHTEDEPLSPLGVYAQSKAAGDLAVATAPRHYLLRTSWVIGDGNNFVRTMESLAEQGRLPQRRRRPDRPPHLHRASCRARPGTCSTSAPTYGTYNLTNGGPATSWADDRAGGLPAVAAATPPTSRR